MKKVLHIIILSFFTFTVVSCSKKKDASSQTCDTLKPDFEKSLSLVNKSGTQISIDMRFWKTTFKDKPDYYYSTYKNNQSANEYDKINSFMASLVGENIKGEFLATNNYCFTLFIDGDISKSQTFNEEAILGFNIYHVKDNFLHHKFFVKGTKEFVENKRLSVKVKGVDVGELYRIAGKYFKPKNNSIIAVNVGITDNSRVDEFKYSEKVRDNLKLKMAYDLSESNVFNRSGGTDEDLFEAYYRLVPVDNQICPAPCAPLANHKYCQASFTNPSKVCKKRSGIEGDICTLAVAASKLTSEMPES